MTAAPDSDAILEARAALDPTGAWVSVDDEGSPAATYTPFMTTDSEGTSYLRDAAPHDLTATVFTYTNYAKVSTSTGDPPNPTATSKNKEGGFPVCKNMDGDHAPFCNPAVDSMLYQDTIYYVTWDPEYYNNTDIPIPKNGTLEVSLRLDYFNRTRENTEEGELVKLDETERVPAHWGVYPLKIEGKHLKGFRPHNLTITLMTNVQGSADKNKSTALNVGVDKHRLPDPELSHGPNNRDLIIALPVVGGVIVFLLIGICLWNRKTRRIQLGNVMSRSRHGYTGRATRKLFNRSGGAGGRGAAGLKDDGIHLETRDPVFEYRDHVPPPGIRRDSDLGSLAGSPVTPDFDHQTRAPGGGNAFRDELRRQDDERRNQRNMY